MNNSQEYTLLDRNVRLYGVVDENSAHEIVSHIKMINDFDEMQEQEQMDMLLGYENIGILKKDSIRGLEAREPIVLEINSGGGFASAGFSIISAIENSETPVIGHVTGDCMSMAIAILAVCDLRISSRFAGFMIHDVRSGYEGKFNEVVSAVGYLKQVRENYKAVLLDYTNLDEEELSVIVDANSDYYLTPTKAKEIGLIDAIDVEGIPEEVLAERLYGIKLETEESKNSKDDDEREDVKDVVDKVDDGSDSEELEIDLDALSGALKGFEY